ALCAGALLCVRQAPALPPLARRHGRASGEGARMVAVALPLAGQRDRAAAAVLIARIRGRMSLRAALAWGKVHRSWIPAAESGRKTNSLANKPIATAQAANDFLLVG